MNNSFAFRPSVFNFQGPISIIAILIALFSLVIIPVVIAFTTIMASLVWLYVKVKGMFAGSVKKQHAPTITIFNKPTGRDTTDAEYIDYEIVD